MESKTGTTTETTTWAVVHHIHQQTPHCHMVRMFITDVPFDVSTHDILRALTRAGRMFVDFGVPWANHYVAPRSSWHDDVERAWDRGEAVRIAYDDLATRNGKKRTAVTLRLPEPLHDRLRRLSYLRGVSGHTILIEAIEGYLSLQEHLLGLHADKEKTL